MHTYAPVPVVFARGEGTILYDEDGRQYLDFLSGLAVTSLGHGHPRLADAIARQARQLVHVSNLFGNELAGPLARAVDELVGDGEKAGGQVFFANSGAEANECAIKLARRFAGRGRFAVVSAYGSFHGRTLATLHATGQPDKHEPFQPLPEGFRHVAYGDIGSLASACDPTIVAAVLLEAVQGEGGVLPAPPGYLTKVRELCDERGILLILDEIQTGLGRTGRWFAFQHEGIRPDVVTMAKALGNGVPIGACWASEPVASAFQPGDHGSTFGGQPLACAAALETLAIMSEIDAPARAERLGRRLAVGLEAVEGIGSVRGSGLLLGALLLEGIDARKATAEALGRGLVVNSPVPGVLRLAPPLTVSEDEIDQALGILAGVLSEQPWLSQGNP
jgi:acetylornithine/N-succinyldiaminopimelate aminotransferase